MRHLFLCREYPPAAYPPGGIGSYVRHITGLLAEAGETVHVIAHRWDGAPRAREESVAGRLIVHRVALDEPVPDRWAVTAALHDKRVPQGLLASSYPSQAFSWQAALLAERLIEAEGVDVIEAQEWEAPLYYLQLRRSLGLGPAVRPPCVVHIHSPSEQIFAANGWDTTVADYRPAVALEKYSITAAEQVLCPSRFVAGQALARYGIDRSRASVIPYPRGDVPFLERSARVWSEGSVCHVGRLEPRKGVIEFADAFASIACEHPDLEIVFVGGDTPLEATGGATVGDCIRARVPRSIRRRLRFLGSRDRGGVIDALSGAFASIVPSRWENFPNSCIEAMCSGLPVIASPNGGMRELVEDGVSGWIAADSTPSGLAGALRRALDTPAAKRESMGRAAAETVRRVCDNGTIVGQHLEMKGRLARQWATPPAPVLARDWLASAGSPGIVAGAAPTGSPEGRRGIGLVVTCPPGVLPLDTCLSGIRDQTEPPAAVCFVCDASFLEAAKTLLGNASWTLIARGAGPADETTVAAAQRMATDVPSLSGLAFIDARVRLHPGFISTCGKVFARDERLGILCPWTHETAPRDRLQVQPFPDAPHVLQDGLIAPCVAVRAAALQSAACPPGEESRARDLRRVLDDVVRAGWAAVAYPDALFSIARNPGDPAAHAGAVRYSSMARAVQRLHTPLLPWFLALPPGDRFAFVRQAVGSPRRSAGWLAMRAMGTWRKPGSLAAPSATGPLPIREVDPPVSRLPDGRMPLVSVVIAAYNASKFIEETCRSVLNQTYARLELIVVDDGSTDETGDIVAALAASDSRVRLIRQHNLGVAAARNCAIAASSGEFVAPLDADDLWDPTKIERQVRRLQECGAETGMVYCWWAWIDSKGEVMDRSPDWRIEGRALEKLIEVNFTGNASVPLFRRSFVEEFGGYNVGLRDQGCQGCEDWDLVLRIAEHYAVAVVPAVLVGYRRRPDSMSAACETMWLSGSKVIEALAERQQSITPAVFWRSKGQLSLHLAGVSFWSGNYLQAIRWGFRVRPLVLGLAVIPHVAWMLVRHWLRMDSRHPNLTLSNGRFEEGALPRPLIPYDRILNRRWRRQAQEASSRAGRARP